MVDGGACDTREPNAVTLYRTRHIRAFIGDHALMAGAQRVGVQLPAPRYSIYKSVLVFKIPTILWSAASGAGQLQRPVGLLLDVMV